MVSKNKGDNRQNENFVQFYRPFMDEIAELGTENPIALKIFMFISKNMDNNNALCVSMNALVEILGYSRQSLSKGVKYLKDKGWLCVLKSGTSNVYILNPEIVWTSYDGQKQYCKFQTNIIVSPSENAEYLKNFNASFKYKHIDDNFINTVREKREQHEKEVAKQVEAKVEFDIETGEIFDSNDLDGQMNIYDLEPVYEE